VTKVRPRQSREAGAGAETLATSAYQSLRKDVLSGFLPAGQKLRIHELCARYDVGLSPMREALSRVSREGLIQHTDLRGFRTAPVSVQELDELTKTRCWVNEIALRQSFANGGQDWEESVLLAFHRLSRIPRPVTENDPSLAWDEAHRIFHSSLIVACGSGLLLNFCDRLFDVADRYRNISRSENARVERDTEGEHASIRDAVLAHDADRAVELLNRHFMVTADICRDKVSRLESVAAIRPSR
jgi:DNA-binding GntR family transcriptional regulator